MNISPVYIGFLSWTLEAFIVVCFITHFYHLPIYFCAFLSANMQTQNMQQLRLIPPDISSSLLYKSGTQLTFVENDANSSQYF